MWLRLHEKGGRRHDMPCHHILEDYLDAYIEAAGLRGAIGNHSFRATGITTYLENGGQLETARAMAAHASTKTTQLYDRRGDQVSLAEIERIRL